MIVAKTDWVTPSYWLYCLAERRKIWAGYVDPRFRADKRDDTLRRALQWADCLQLSRLELPASSGSWQQPRMWGPQLPPQAVSHHQPPPGGGPASSSKRRRRQSHDERPPGGWLSPRHDDVADDDERPAPGTTNVVKQRPRRPSSPSPPALGLRPKEKARQARLDELVYELVLLDKATGSEARLLPDDQADRYRKSTYNRLQERARRAQPANGARHAPATRKCPRQQVAPGCQPEALGEVPDLLVARSVSQPEEGATTRVAAMGPDPQPEEGDWRAEADARTLAGSLVRRAQRLAAEGATKAGGEEGKGGQPEEGSPPAPGCQPEEAPRRQPEEGPLAAPPGCQPEVVGEGPPAPGCQPESGA